jgi:hypothetical protein
MGIRRRLAVTVRARIDERVVAQWTRQGRHAQADECRLRRVNDPLIERGRQTIRSSPSCADAALGHLWTGDHEENLVTCPELGRLSHRLLR